MSTRKKKNKIKNIKKNIIKLKNNVIKMYKKSKLNIFVPIISILILILGSIFIGFILSFVLAITLNLLYFVPKYSKKNNKKEVDNMKKKKKKKKTRILKIFFLISLILFIFCVMACLGFMAYIVTISPTFTEEALYVTEPTILYDKDGKEIDRIGTENRVKITYEDLPEVVIDAIVSTEDSNFFEHKGVDWPRFIKASISQLMGNSDAGGASTLTMQVSKNAFTSTEASGIQGIIRKFTDVYVSMFEIEKNYTKEKIMEFYVNSNYMGNKAYGVEQAALTYFNKKAKDLNLSEAAMLAGLFQAPGRYDPYTNLEATERRRQTVLKLMLRHEYITKKEYNIALKLTVDKIVVPKSENKTLSDVSEYQSFIDTVVQEVQDKTKDNPYTTPMKIYTTMNRDFQKHITNIMNGKTYTWENNVVQAGVAVIDVKTGAVSAIGGGRNIDALSTYNYAVDIKRQIGSTAKPLYDYGPAIEYLNWSTYQILVDEPITYSDGTKINNWNGAFEGFETMRIALKGSRNIPALKAFKKNNKGKIIEFVTNLGLTPEIYSCESGYSRDGKKCIKKDDPNIVVDAKKASTLHEAHAIGGYNGESPLTMAAAYAAFANGGTYNEPHSYTKLIYQKNNTEVENDFKSNKAMSQETAYMISDMLVTTSTQALGRYANVNGIRYAAKTGTTNYDDETLKAHGLYYTSAVNDLWVIGYNTEYAIGVWYGYDKVNSKYYNILSSGQHSRLFQTVAQKVFTNANYFTKPNGVIEVTLENENPEPILPSEYTPSHLKITELFKKGTEPTTVSERFSKLNDVSNLDGSATGNWVTLTWDGIEKPKINTESTLKKLYSSVFENNGYLDAFIRSRISWNSSNLGKLGYYIYEQIDGKLVKIGFTEEEKYRFRTSSGDHTFIVKSSYSIFTNNQSNGKSYDIKTFGFIDGDYDDNDDNDDNDVNNDQNNDNSNNNTNDTENNSTP